VKHSLQIGVTGGIGSGKSLVCRIFSSFGIPVYDADSRAKALMTTDGILMSQIRKEFGDLSYDEQGNLNRTFLASSVFSNAERLKRLNSLVHPRVGEDYTHWYEAAKDRAPYVLKEAALLFESGSHKYLDRIIVVFAPVDIRIRRVLHRDPHRTKEQIEEIIQRQLADEEKIKLADYIITNDESVLLIPQIVSLHQFFVEEKF
jgi:dephospho-CoA kinase